MDTSNFLVLTDSLSEDVQELYPVEGAAASATSVSVPFKPVDEFRPKVAVRVASDPGPVGAVWSGRLDLPSGVLVVSDWSMSPLARHSVEAGLYQVDVDFDPAHGSSVLLVILAPAP
jgi:hypothetical protein